MSRRPAEILTIPKGPLPLWQRLQRPLALVVLLLLAAAFALGPSEAWLTSAFTTVGEAGLAGVAIFIALFIVATIILVPGSILTIAAGFLFGLVGGILVVSIASLLAALATLAVGRYIAHDFVYKRLAGNGRMGLLLRVIEERGFRAVLLARLVPFLPYNLLNYALSLTRVKWRPYILGTLIGMVPGSLVLVYIGAAAGDLTRAMTSLDGLQETPWILYALSALFIVLSSWWLGRRATRELNTMMAEVDEQKAEPGL